MCRPLFKPSQSDELTCARIQEARANKPFPVQLFDARDPDRASFPGTATLSFQSGEYWFTFVADHDELITFSEPREMVLAWIRPPVDAGASGYQRSQCLN